MGLVSLLALQNEFSLAQLAVKKPPTSVVAIKS